jgi:hypothetical protein
MRPRVSHLPLFAILSIAFVPGLQRAAVGQVQKGSTELADPSVHSYLVEEVKLDIGLPGGTELKPGADFGTLLAERLRVTSSADGKTIQLGLWVEAFSQKEGSLGRFDTFPVHFEPGRVYPGKAWIQDPSQMNELLAPGFGDRRKEGLVVQQVVVINHEEQYSVVNHEEQYSISDQREDYSPVAKKGEKVGIVFPDVCKDSPYALVIGVSAPESKGEPSTPKCVVCLVE